MLPDIEVVSAAVHAAWMDSKRAQGVTTRKAEDGEELMAPYEQLSEKAKQLDRGTVQAVYAAINASASESGLDKALDHAEVIGNVTAALLDLDATYDGNRVTFTFQSTNDAMRYIHKARAIVQERLAAIRALQSPACSVCGARPAESCANLKSPCTRRS